MDVGDWVGIGGLAIALGTVAVNIGVTKAKISSSERRLAALEKVRDRMGEQVHKATSDIRVMAAMLGERLPKRSTTLTGITNAPTETAAEGSDEHGPPSEPT
jgi:hypothetical protein